MALINCMECGREISDKAAACPQCGAPICAAHTVSEHETRADKVDHAPDSMEKTALEKRLNVISWVISFAVVMGLALYFGVFDSNTPPTQAARAPSSSNSVMPSVPSCKDQRTIRMLQNNIASDMASTLDVSIRKGLTYEIHSIRAISTNPRTGAHECTAMVIMRTPIQSRDGELAAGVARAFTYTVKASPDGRSFSVDWSPL